MNAVAPAQAPGRWRRGTRGQRLPGPGHLPAPALRIGFPLLLLLVLVGPPAAGAAEGPLRVVYHVNQGDSVDHLRVLRYVQDHIDAVGAEQMDIKIVMHGRGLDLLTGALENPEVRASVDILKLQDVGFQVCGNSLRARGLTLEQLYDTTAVDRVDSGVGQIARLQHVGYTYIKP